MEFTPMKGYVVGTADYLTTLRNGYYTVVSSLPLYPEGFAFIPPPASPSDNIPPATVQQHMGAYYPQTAQCTVHDLRDQRLDWLPCLHQSGPISR
jgi:hypothetical protein